MAYEPRTFQSTTTNTPPTGTDPAVDNTVIGDVQAIKLLDPTAGSTTPMVGQKASTGSMPVVIASDQTAILVTLTSTTITGTVDTELPTAAVLADNTANPTAPAVASFLLVWDGSTWDRLPGTAVDGALVNLGSNNDVTVTGTITANLGTIGSAATAAKQDTEIASLASLVTQTDGIEASLVSILAKIIAAPATEAKQDTANTSLASIDAGTPAALGQAVMADSQPVVIASNQTAVPVSLTSTTITGAVDTELPAAAALADNAANPTAPAVGAFGMVWDGSTWDRLPGSSTDGALVNMGANNDVTITGGTITANLGTIGGAATEAKQDTANTSLASLVTQTDGVEASLTSILAKIIAAPATEAKQDTGNTSLASILAKIIAAPATEAKQDTGNTSLASLVTQTDGIEASLSSIDAGTPAALGQTTMASSQPIVIASDQTVLPVKETRAATSAVTSVADTDSNTTLLASNAARLGATIYNESTVDLHAKLGATASLTSYTIKIAPSGYYEVPFGYTGVIDGIWTSNASGSARITELSA